jgi:molybdopterin/thiamine biosynthesis adenylyltransferase/nitroreductase
MTPDTKHCPTADDEAKRFMDVAFSRNLGILTPHEQHRLASARVAIPGLGGVGGVYCATLARLGLGCFHLADMDRFALVNFNRQYGACLRHLGETKLSAMAEEIRQINPHAAIETFPDGVTLANMDAFLGGVDLVLDGLDFFALDIRRALFARARQLGIPVVTAAPLGFTSSVLVFTPDGMSFDDYFALHDGLDARERALRFAVGLAPRGLHLGQIDPSRVSLEQKKGPSLIIACHLCAALAATETVRLLTGRPGVMAVPRSFQIDPLGRRMCRLNTRGGNGSLIQRAKLWFVRNILLGGNGGHLRPIPGQPDLAPQASSPPPPHLTWLVEAAIQAPSGDNCQPWRFRVEADGLRVLVAPEVDRSFFNVGQLASIIACGAAVQNIVSAAPDLGWQARPRLMPDPGNADVVAAVSFTPWTGLPDPLGEAVWSRCTNRRMYGRRRVEKDCQDRLVAAAAPASLLLVDDAPRIRKLARLLYLADRIRVERRDLHEHFMGMTHFDRQSAARATDGFPLKNLQAGLAGEVFLRLTRPWPAMRLANTLGLGRLVAANSRLGMAGSPLAGLVCATSPSREDFLKGGMALERVWLTATRQGLAVQPMTAITLFWVRWHLEGPDAFSRRHRRSLQEVWTGLAELFPELGDTCWPVMLFRAGRARPVRYGTPRRPVAESLLGGIGDV